MNLLKFLREKAGRTSLAPRPKGNPYIARIDILLEGVVIRKIEMTIRANNRQEAEEKIALKVATDIAITTKVHRAKVKPQKVKH